jgi:hypothetical protein
MCIEFWRALERLEERSESESLDRPDAQDADGNEPVGPRKTGWVLPAEPVQACGWSPA